MSRNLSRSRIVLFSVESCLILGVLHGISYLTFLYHTGNGSNWLLEPYPQVAKALVVLLACQLCMYMNELYDPKVAANRRELGIRLLQALGAACIILSVIYLFWGSISIRQSTFLISLPTTIFLLYGWRRLYAKILRSDALAERVVILGNDPSVGKILEEIPEGKGAGFEVTALVNEDGAQIAGLPNLNPVKTVLHLEEFPQKAASLAADRMVVAIQDRRGKMPFRTLLNCRFRGVQVEEAATFYEALTGKILLDKLRPSWFIFSEGFRISPFTLRVKRALDLVMAGLLLVVASPVMLMTAALIKLDSKGPAIYKQDRVGAGWKEYTLYKFRSMVQDAEASGVKWAEEDDPRVTRVGRVIRRYRIDELSQLFNVLKGDMSFVGPRPERRFFVEELAKEIPYYPYRLFVKPGLTGWAQIKFHYGASKNETMEKLQYDLYYIKHISLYLDLSIIFDTVRVVLSGAGAR
jgi:sugar transferase (PEP-CTERM system associated)